MLYRMPERSSNRRNGVRRATSRENGSTSDEPVADPNRGKNAAAVELGRLGGLKGGPARADKLSPKKRSAIARKAAQARWAKRDQ